MPNDVVRLMKSPTNEVGFNDYEYYPSYFGPWDLDSEFAFVHENTVMHTK